MRFSWDAQKELRNKKVHGIGFQEATTVFGDALAVTVADPNHSVGEARLITIGQTASAASSSYVTPNKAIPFALFRREELRLTSEKTMKHKVKEPEMRPEYDFSGGVRGKYYKRYREGSNVVLLDPDVHQRFRDSAAVNRALRSLMRAEQRSAQKGSARPRAKAPRR